MLYIFSFVVLFLMIAAGLGLYEKGKMRAEIERIKKEKEAAKEDAEIAAKPHKNKKEIIDDMKKGEM